jgi:hypothetical protein
LQLTHEPRQPVLQQTPSAQKPDAQSVFFAQIAPRGLGPQLPLTQTTPATQSSSDLHVVTQAFFDGSQSNGAQIVAGPDLQRPRPSQTSTSTTAASWQEPGLQIVPATWLRQAPLPSQVPSSPHVDTSAAGHAVGWRGALPAGTKEQMPGAPCTSHDLQASVQALLQQTPSTQKPLPQSALQPHASPFILLPLARPSPPLVHDCGPSVWMSIVPASPWPVDLHPLVAVAIANAIDSAPKRTASAGRRVDELPPRTPRSWGSNGRRQADELRLINRAHHIVCAPVEVRKNARAG